MVDWMRAKVSAEVGPVLGLDSPRSVFTVCQVE